MSDQTPGTRFGDGHRLVFFSQQLTHHRFEGLVALAIDEITDPLANDCNHPFNTRIGLGNRSASCNHSQEVVGETRAKGELGLAILRYIREFPLERGLSHPEGSQQPGPDPGSASASLESIGDSGQYLLVHHEGELTGNSRHAKDEGPLFFE